MSLKPDSYKALLSGHSWAGDEIYGTPGFVTFSFPLTQPREQDDLGIPAFPFTPLSASEQAVVREALHRWESVAGIHFLEVKPAEGDINFSEYEFDEIGASKYAGLTHLPESYGVGDGSDYAGYFTPVSGDVLFDRNLGHNLFKVALHEIGHAIGLKHPFDGLPGHEEVLSAADATTRNTVMAYGDMSGDLRPLDIEAAQKLYGAAGSYGAETFHWRPKAEVLNQVGGDGRDVIIGINLKDVIYGGAGADRLIGLDGDDRLVGGAGNDKLSGGSGGDEFVFKGHAGADRIADFEQGADQLVFARHRGFDGLEDLTMRYRGDDLVLSWDDGSVRLQYAANMHLTESDVLFV